jgi:phosphatidylserine/phosphatidylglycerophosphate/cardiolipin synthase-like enzyme
VLGTLAQAIADRRVDVAGCVDSTQIREVVHQWEENRNVSWKLPLLEHVMAGTFSGKESTPFGAGTVHDFMHAKVTVCDDTVFVGSFNLSRSGEKNAENVLELRDEAIADRLAAYVDDVRARYGPVTIRPSAPGRPPGGAAP